MNTCMQCSCFLSHFDVFIEWRIVPSVRAGASTTPVLVLPKMINMNILKTLYSSTDFPVLVLICSVLTPAQCVITLHSLQYQHQNVIMSSSFPPTAMTTCENIQRVWWRCAALPSLCFSLESCAKGINTTGLRLVRISAGWKKIDRKSPIITSTYNSRCVLYFILV